MDQVYETIGAGDAGARSPAPRIAEAFGGARTVVNVGAGTGNYEPIDRRVVAMESTLRMLVHRAVERAPALQAIAEALPFANGAFDAALATLTLHHWSDYSA